MSGFAFKMFQWLRISHEAIFHREPSHLQRLGISQEELTARTKQAVKSHRRRLGIPEE